MRKDCDLFFPCLLQYRWVSSLGAGTLAHSSLSLKHLAYNKCSADKSASEWVRTAKPPGKKFLTGSFKCSLPLDNQNQDKQPAALPSEERQHTKLSGMVYSARSVAHVDGEGSCGHPVVIVTILSKAWASTVEMFCICVPLLSSLIHSFNKYLLNPRHYSSMGICQWVKNVPFFIKPTL